MYMSRKRQRGRRDRRTVEAERLAVFQIIGITDALGEDEELNSKRCSALGDVHRKNRRQRQIDIRDMVQMVIAKLPLSRWFLAS